MDIQVYNKIKKILETARSQAYYAVNHFMVNSYWNIGKVIADSVGGDKRAQYGAGIIKELSKRLTSEYGKGFDKTNLGRMKQFYLMFPNVDAVRQQLSWSHYRMIMKVEKESARNFYLK